MGERKSKCAAVKGAGFPSSVDYKMWIFVPLSNLVHKCCFDSEPAAQHSVPTAEWALWPYILLFSQQNEACIFWFLIPPQYRPLPQPVRSRSRALIFTAHGSPVRNLNSLPFCTWDSSLFFALLALPTVFPPPPRPGRSVLPFLLSSR